MYASKQYILRLTRVLYVSCTPGILLSYNVVAFAGISLYRSVIPPWVHPYFYICHLFTEWDAKPEAG